MTVMMTEELGQKGLVDNKLTLGKLAEVWYIVREGGSDVATHSTGKRNISCGRI